MQRNASIQSRHSGFAENTQGTELENFATLFDFEKACRLDRRHLRYLRFGSQVTRGEGFYGTPLAQSGDRSLLEHFESVWDSFSSLINFKPIRAGEQLIGD